MMMKEKLINDIECIRHINSAMVLNQLRKRPKMSRPNLADNLGLSKVTISNIIYELHMQGLTTEAGIGMPDSRGGRKPLLVSLDRDTKRVLAAELSETGVELVLSDITGFIIKSQSEPLELDDGPLTLAGLGRQLAALTEEILSSTNTPRNSVLGLAMVSHGQVDGQGGMVIWGGNGQGQPEPLAASLEDAVKMPVRVEGRTRSRAMSERWFGQCGDSTAYFYVDLGDRLEGSLVVKGQLSDRPINLGACGVMSESFESGHRKARPLSELASGRALAHKAGLAYDRPVTSAELADMAEAGDGKALALFAEMGYHLGLGLAMVANMLDPQEIILGGDMVPAGKFFGETFNETIRQNTGRPGSTLTISNHSLGRRAGLMGALALSLDNWVFRTNLL